MDPRGGTDRIRLGPGVRVDPSALRFSFVTSGGPGGQNVNKRSTKAVLRVFVAELGMTPDAADRLRAARRHWLTDDDELVIACDTHRSQHRNRAACIELLRGAVLGALQRPKARRPTRPTRGSVERRLDAKKRRAEIKKRRRPPTD